MEEPAPPTDAAGPQSKPATEGPSSLTERLDELLWRWDEFRTRPVFVAALVAGIGVLVAVAVVAGRGLDRGANDDAIPHVALTPTTVSSPAEPIVIHVAGQVRHPGVYVIPAGSRVLDAIEAAGGPTDDADVNLLNLAAPAVDGARIHVPAPGETVFVDTGSSPSAGLPVDLNRASATELEALPGIGPATAARIVDHRNEHGPFATVEDLLAVPGIGPVKFDGLRDHVRVS